MRKTIVASSLAILLAGSGAALAETSRLTVLIGGEAYDGPPRFEVRFNDTVLGERAVASAIDTATAGRFEAASDRAAHTESFDFDIPEAVFKPDGEISIRLVNEAFGGEGSDRDRNLFLAALSVNGRAVTLSGLSTRTDAGTRDNATVGEFLLIADGTVAGIAPAPAGGWPAPEAEGVAEAPSTPKSAGPAARRIPVSASREEPVAEVAAPAPVTAEAEAALTTASIAATPTAAAGDCAGTRYNVLGFRENSNDLTPGIAERLGQVLADIGKRRCTVEVVGYSSNDGLHATNALFALERAQNVAAFLRQNGLDAAEVKATGGGATTAFGPRPSENRRVVITLAP
ncbi:MAG: OmpA family protein [Devosia sp.]